MVRINKLRERERERSENIQRGGAAKSCCNLFNEVFYETNQKGGGAF